MPMRGGARGSRPPSRWQWGRGSCATPPPSPQRSSDASTQMPVYLPGTCNDTMRSIERMRSTAPAMAPSPSSTPCLRGTAGCVQGLQTTGPFRGLQTAGPFRGLQSLDTHTDTHRHSQRASLRAERDSRACPGASIVRQDCCNELVETLGPRWAPPARELPRYFC